MSKSVTKLFESLGAPLKNQRWSWGAVDANGTIFLRVWQNEKQPSPESGQPMYQLTSHQCFGDGSNPGYNERDEHIALFEQGAKCFLVIVHGPAPIQPCASRSIVGVKSDALFPMVKLHRDESGDYWGEVGKPVKIEMFKTP